LGAQAAPAQNKVTATYTFPAIAIKDFQNKKFPGSVANDRKVLLGSVGSDLWHDPNGPRDEFWMLTDRGPNGQIAVEGKNRRTFWVREFNPTILKVNTEGRGIRILETVAIVGQSGEPVTGLPNIKDYDETPYTIRRRKRCPSMPTASTPKASCTPALYHSAKRRRPSKIAPIRLR
jgi:hypothetical protein